MLVSSLNTLRGPFSRLSARLLASLSRAIDDLPDRAQHVFAPAHLRPGHLPHAGRQAHAALLVLARMGRWNCALALRFFAGQRVITLCARPAGQRGQLLKLISTALLPCVPRCRRRPDFGGNHEVDLPDQRRLVVARFFLPLPVGSHGSTARLPRALAPALLARTLRPWCSHLASRAALVGARRPLIAHACVAATTRSEMEDVPAVLLADARSRAARRPRR
jgi:hypothetical protein